MRHIHVTDSMYLETQGYDDAAADIDVSLFS